ncbi:MAG: primosomal protein N' [Prevotella sp.]|nr:primosomal protein N' [Prevotella sp.]
MFIDVILPLPLDGVFTYSVPPELERQVAVGHRVLVPFGRNKTYVGIVAQVNSPSSFLLPPSSIIKSILQVLDTSPILLDSQLNLWRWISDYYLSPIGEVYKAALPAGLKAEDGYRPKTETYIRLTPKFRSERALHIALDMLQRAPSQQKAFIDFLDLAMIQEDGSFVTSPEDVTKEPSSCITRDELLNESHTLATISALVKRGLIETYEQEVGRLNHGGEPHPEQIKQLSLPQQEAFNQIQFAFLKKPVTLLHGVTSSGKTEIYIHLIQQALDTHQQVLYLLPEIALTVQMMDRLQRVFGNRLGIYHSKYADAERVEIWQKQLSKNPYDVILGARSAVFLPFQRLGLIIVDEEHETSYKQQDPMPRYHARSAAIMLAKMRNEECGMRNDDYSVGCKVLLGTATPCAETWHNAQTGKYGYVLLTERYNGIELPEIQVIDIKDLQHRKMMHGPFSPTLLLKVREALERGEQAILFQNRRGYAPMIECKQCGWVPHCQHCDVSLTFHRNLNQLTCHYCGYTYQVPTECPACGSHELQTRGYGTEKIEDEVRAIFPEARIARMDLDTTRTRQAYERIINDFSAGRTNLLIGTQMISKGLDFDKVSVVGILNADIMLNYPDFRAYEHAFMMMSQVSGRAGRKGRRGLVILQTKSPDNPVIHQVVSNDYAAFFRSLLAERREYRYPPFTRLVYVYLKHRSESLVDTASHVMGSRLRQWFGTRVLGPDRPAVAKVKSLAIRKLLLKIEPGLDLPTVRKYLVLAQQQMQQDKRYASLQIYFDVDPL